MIYLFLHLTPVKIKFHNVTIPEKRVLVAQKLILCYSPEKAADLSKLKHFFPSHHINERLKFWFAKFHNFLMARTSLNSSLNTAT